MLKISRIPISLYVHVPWCKKKCPYCDFNSHAESNLLNKQKKEYMSKLVLDLKHKLNYLYERRICSIFIGGGTPSLFNGNMYQALFEEIKKKTSICNDTEITIEANPGTLKEGNLEEYRGLGINRISIGAQSLQNKKLKHIKRIHNAEEVKSAILTCRKSGFENINIDLMFGLPNQSIGDAISDLRTITNLNPSHISWYRFTLESKTGLYKNIPKENTIWNIQEIGKSLLRDSGFHQYEISSFAKDKKECKHNTNYWEFGDYIGIGAGAHGKVTLSNYRIQRYYNTKNPKIYLKEGFDANKNEDIVSKKLSNEFFINSLSLFSGIDATRFEQRTGLPKYTLKDVFKIGLKNKLMDFTKDRIFLTKIAKGYLNDILFFLGND